MNKYLVNYIENGIRYSIDIDAISESDAEWKANLMGLVVDYDHLCPIGRLLKTVPEREDGSPDWANAVDHELVRKN